MKKNHVYVEGCNTQDGNDSKTNQKPSQKLDKRKQTPLIFKKKLFFIYNHSFIILFVITTLLCHAMPLGGASHLWYNGIYTNRKNKSCSPDDNVS